MREPSDLQLRFDWQPADDGVIAPELRATFARLEVRVGQDCVTLVGDRATGSVRRTVVVSLYPLAEWIVFNWWRLQYDGRPPSTTTAGWRSHTTSFVGDGFCWPELQIIPEGEICRMQWRKQRRSVTGWPIDYLAQGSAWGRREQVIGAFGHLVEAVLGRLEEAGIRDILLAKEWEALRSLGVEETEFCRAVARLGVDPLGDGVRLAGAVDQAWNTVGDVLAPELLDAASVPELTNDIAWLTSVIEEMGAPVTPADDAALLAVRAGVEAVGGQTAGKPPWVVGWEAARAARLSLGLAPIDPFPDDLSPVAESVRELPDHGLIAAGQAGAVVMTRRMGYLSRRFVGGRALFHAAAGPVDQPFLLTRAASEHQATGRAFAAELLVPSDGVAALSDNEVGEEDIARIGDHYRASDQIVRHQIENQLTRA